MKRITVALTIALLALCLCAGALAQIECESYLDYGNAVSALTNAQGKSPSSDELASRLLMRSKKPMENLESFGPIGIVAGPQNHYTLQFSSPSLALECMQALKSDKNVIYVQQDSLVTAYADKNKSASAKADPYLSWGAKAMGADDLAASITASGSVTVAVVDSGVKSHPFLNSRVKTGGVDFTDPTRADGRNDVNGHGTHVAGTIVDLTQGLNVKILPVRVLGDNGSGSNSGVCNGIRYAADAGAKIINMSLGGQLFTPYDVSSEEKDAINYAVGKGVTIVVAAGNDAMDTNSFQPACFDKVIVVAAINSAYDIADFSNYGDSVDVCAPGVNITSCSINGGYTDFNGTSMASPHVAAIAAMVKLQNPGFSPARVESYIKSHCLDLGADGWDRTFGNGMPCFIVNDEGSEGGYAYKKVSDGALITAYEGTEQSVTVPETLAGLPVIGIEENAFKANATLESLRIPGCVKEIGNFAFANCPLLKTVALEEGVIRIGDSAFSGCEALSGVELPKSVKNIGGEAFKGCKELKSVTLPSAIEAMGAYALSETGITSITIPASLGCVPSRLFTNCQSLESVVIENGVTRIDVLAFDNCVNLKTISLPKSVTKIDQAAFRGAGLESAQMPGVKTLNYGAFLYCDKLVSIELPETLESIGELVFCECPALEKVVLPRSLKSIAPDAFEDTPHVVLHGYTGSVAEDMAKSANIPFVSIGYQTLMTKLIPADEEALEIEVGQFVQAEGMYSFEPEDATYTELEWTCSNPAVCEIGPHVFAGESYMALHSLAAGECVVTGKAKDGSGLSVSLRVVVGDASSRYLRLSKNAVTAKVGETAKLTAVVFPESADQSVVWTSDDTSIATVDQTGLITALGVGETTVTAVSALDAELSDICVVTVEAEAPATQEFKIRALDDNTAAVTGYSGTSKTVDIPSVIDGYKIVMIDEGAFRKSDITSVSIPEGVLSIGAKAFAECKTLASAKLPDSLTTLARDAFKGCKKLPKVKKIELRLTKADVGFILVPVFTPANTASAYSVALSNKKNATVSAEGLVTPLNDNYFNLTVKAGGKKAVLGVANGEPYAASKVTINGKAKRTLKMGGELKLAFTVKPESARVIATWTSDNPEVAIVDQDGTVTPVAPGKAKITLQTDIGLSDFVTVTVK